MATANSSNKFEISKPERLQELPDFYILGAPKCGTTAMAAYLSENPEILFSHPKETNFFNTDHKEQELFKTLDEYLDFAFPKHKGAKLKGEGSVWYLFSEHATANILSLKEDAKFVVMLREPAELVYALHSTYLLGVMENEDDFEKAWRLQDQRSKSMALPPTCPEPKLLQYGKVGKLGTQVESLLNCVSNPKQIHFIIYDDFKKDTQAEYKKLLHFLGLKDDGRTDFSAINVAAKTKNKSLGKSISALTQNKALYRLKRSLGFKMGSGPMVKLLAKNRVIAKREELRPEFKSELRAYFKEDVKKLEALINRDLKSWYD
tara:strand:+ start:161824 stop:162780 length:957 start_codon:yes stop_codon:yes gene_type:complete